MITQRAQMQNLKNHFMSSKFHRFYNLNHQKKSFWCVRSEFATLAVSEYLKKSENSKFFQKNQSTSLICKILASPKLFPMNFLERLVCSTTCIWYRTRSTNNLSQNELAQLELFSKMSPKSINNFGPMLTHFARWFPKSRAKCRITLRDKLYDSLPSRLLIR